MALFKQPLEEEARKRREIEEMPMVGAHIITKVLTSFDSEERRLSRVAAFLGARKCEK